MNPTQTPGDGAKERPILIATNFRWSLWARICAFFYGVTLVNAQDHPRT